jgi:quinol monooxygenase YgiN
MTDDEDPRRILYAEFAAKPGNERRVARLLREYASRVHAEAGSLIFAAHRKQDDPAQFFIYEEYADSAAFAAHLGTDYGSAFNRELAELIVGDHSDLTFLSPV